ncbi:hypothetical protein CDL12_17079 [Handroanthus impetiginosus]|uniref:Uncharacterized protein n=1 Tax=Handroanthus impetiginosus TaxID=429701 RepID=A0A2G9GYI3_9LAMI|nr:hypothetical protein CDL12_17079 [Handroanthus impetiginosus]
MSQVPGKSSPEIPTRALPVEKLGVPPEVLRRMPNVPNFDPIPPKKPADPPPFSLGPNLNPQFLGPPDPIPPKPEVPLPPTTP